MEQELTSREERLAGLLVELGNLLGGVELRDMGEETAQVNLRLGELERAVANLVDEVRGVDGTGRENDLEI